MNPEKIQKNNDEERSWFSRNYSQEYMEKSDKFVDDAEMVKKTFNAYIDRLRALLNTTPLYRGDCCLDDTRKKELKQCLTEWNMLMKALDLIESNIKQYTNDILWCFQGNAKGKVAFKFYMINETAFRDIVDYDIRFTGTEVVPDVLSDCLFNLHIFFMLLASCTATAWQTRQDIIAIYENDPQKIRECLNKDLKPFWDYVLQFKEQIDAINKKQEQTNKGNKIILNDLEDIKRKQDVSDAKSSRENKRLEEKITKRNKADKRKALTQEECADSLYKQKKIYFKKKEDYLRKVGKMTTVPKHPKDAKMVERTIQRWDLYLSSDGKKGVCPPSGYSRERSRKEFDCWAETVEQIAYEKWEKKQPIIRRKNKTIDGFSTTFSP